MAGHLERLCPHAGVVRIGGQHGQPFRWAVTVHWCEPDGVEVKGLSQTPTRQDWRDVGDVLAANGVKRFRYWRRRSDGTMRMTRWFETEKGSV